MSGSKLWWLTGLLVIIIAYGGKGQQLIVSASKRDYIVYQNVQKGNSLVIDVNHRKRVGEVDSTMSFLCWVKDSSIIFLSGSAPSQFITIFQIRSDTLHKLESIPVPALIDLSSTDVKAFPNQIDKLEDLFLVFIRNNKLYKLYPLQRDTVELADFKPMEGLSYNNITVNDDGSIVFASQISPHYGIISKLDTRTHRTQIVARGRGFGYDDVGVYFLQDNHTVIYYKVIGKEDITKLHELVMYNLNDQSYRKIGVITGGTLLNSFVIYPMKCVVVNALDAHPVDLAKIPPGVDSFLEAIFSNVGFIEIKI